MTSPPQFTPLVIDRFDDEYNGHTEKILSILEDGKKMLYVEDEAKKKINSDTKFTIQKLGGKFTHNGEVYRLVYWKGWETPTLEPIKELESSYGEYHP